MKRLFRVSGQSHRKKQHIVKCERETVTIPKAKGSGEVIELPEPSECQNRGRGAQQVLQLYGNAATARDTEPEQGRSEGAIP